MKIKKISLTNQIMLAMVLGIGTGLLFTENITKIQIVGDIFLRLIQMSIVILVMGQVIEAVGNLNPSTLGRVGIKTIVLFSVSSVLAALYGIVMAILFKPGYGLSNYINEVGEVDISADNLGSFEELLLDFFPTNIINALSEGAIVQVVIFACIFGIAISKVSLENEKNQFLSMIVQFNEVILKMINIVIKLAPVGVFAIVAATIGEVGIQVVIPLAKYLLVYAFATLTFLLLWFVITAIYSRCSLVKLIQKTMQVSIMALATTSSVVTFPTALKATEEKLGVKRRVAKLVVPLGATVNSNGAAMYMAITVVTIAQIYQISYSYQDYFYIAILVTLISLGSAGVPGGGIVALTIVIPQMQIPLESIALFVGIDWFTGML